MKLFSAICATVLAVLLAIALIAVAGFVIMTAYALLRPLLRPAIDRYRDWFEERTR